MHAFSVRGHAPPRMARRGTPSHVAPAGGALHGGALHGPLHLGGALHV